MIYLSQTHLVLLQSGRRLVLLHGVLGLVLIEESVSEVEVRDGIRVVPLDCLLILDLSFVVNAVSHQAITSADVVSVGLRESSKTEEQKANG